MWGIYTLVNITIIGSNSGLSPGWCQAIIWTNAGIWLIGHFGTNLSDIFNKINIFFYPENTFESVIYEILSKMANIS